MAFQHQNLAAGKWQTLSLAEQMANIGSEISRALKWRGRDERIFQGAFGRALELFDLTLGDSRWQQRLKEISRAREFFCGAIIDNNSPYSLVDLEKYFLPFAVLANRQRNNLAYNVK